MLTATEPLLDRARMFKALGDPTRLRIFEFLRARCRPVAVEETGEVRPIDGPSFGEVCCHVTGKLRVTSTISFHLNELKDAGLITVERRGKHMICGVDQSAVGELAKYLAANSNSCEEC